MLNSGVSFACVLCHNPLETRDHQFFYAPTRHMSGRYQLNGYFSTVAQRITPSSSALSRTHHSNTHLVSSCAMFSKLLYIPFGAKETEDGMMNFHLHRKSSFKLLITLYVIDYPHLRLIVDDFFFK